MHSPTSPPTPSPPTEPTPGNAGYNDSVINRVGKWKVMFGKHKGTTYNAMVADNMDYLKWMYDNDVVNNQDIISFLDIVVK